MIDYIGKVICMTVRLLGFAVVVVLVAGVGSMYFLPPAQADERTSYDFDFKTPEGLRKYLRHFGHKFVYCNPDQFLVGMTKGQDGKVKLICVTPNELEDDAIQDFCSRLGFAVNKPLTLISRDGSRFTCGVPRKMAESGDSLQDA